MKKTKTIGWLALPPVIRKNVFLFIGGFLCLFINFQIGIPLFSKAALEFFEKKELIGLPLTLISLASAVMAVPLGKMADKVGRKLAGIVSIFLFGSGFVVLAWAISANSWSIFLSGLIVSGAGLSGTLVFVLAVTDMFPLNRKGEAAGLAFLGLYGGQMVGPFIGGAIAESYGFIYAFLTGSAFAVFGIILLLFVDPDPLEIGINLEKYYPELKEGKSTEEKEKIKFRNIAQIFRLYPIQVQFWSRILAHTPRVVLIVLAPIVLTEIGYSMVWIGTLFMMLGMGAFVTSFPIGRLADRFGRKKIIFWATIISMLALAAEVYTISIILLMIIFFVIGFGFTAINNIAASMVADVTHPLERGKAMGFFGIGSAMGPVIFPILVSWVYGNLGPKYVSWVGVAIMSLTLLLLIPLRERTPGIYDHVGCRPEDIPK